VPRRHYRTDRGTLGAVERLGTGALRVSATVTRIGIFEYVQPDGSVVRELRPPDEVYAPESIASLRGVPVTDLHPSEAVTLGSWPELTRGHVEAPRVVGDHIDADVVVSHPELVTLIEQKRRRENSCGYDCEIDPTPGEWYGAPYDVVQRKILYNHVALGPTNWARGGSSVRLHLDSKHKEQSMEVNFDREGKTLRVDGVDYVLPADKDKAVAALRAMARKERRVDQMEPAQVASVLDETRGHLAMALEMLGGVLADLVSADEQVVEMTSETADMGALEQMAMDRADTLDRARKIAPKLDAKGLKTGEIHRKALEESGYKLDGGETDDFVRGVFSARTSFSGIETFPREDQRAMGQGAGAQGDPQPRRSPLADRWERGQKGARA
jgi:hypothetical protein